MFNIRKVDIPRMNVLMIDLESIVPNADIQYFVSKIGLTRRMYRVDMSGSGEDDHTSMRTCGFRIGVLVGNKFLPARQR